MDYRNSDGSLSEMCGNGIRVFALHLAQEGLVDPTQPVPIGTRDGVKVLSFDGDLITADMGTPKVLGETRCGSGRRPARRGTSTWATRTRSRSCPPGGGRGAARQPGYDAGLYPDGVNIEFVVRRGDAHVAMRVHERGSGETRSCGTGACAVMVAAALADGAARDTTYRVDVPGGTLQVTWTADDRVLLTGPCPHRGPWDHVALSLGHRPGER